jgi:hypothetical protein
MTATRIRSYHPDTDVAVDLWITDCASCGVIFAIPRALEQRRRKDAGSFYCPNGHSMWFGKSEADKEREKREQAERQAECVRASRDAWRDQAEAAERRRRAIKGQLTKVKKRVAAGVCPCCNRTFADLARHMAGQHPNYVAPVARDD